MLWRDMVTQPRLSVAPTAEPVSVDELRTHCRIDDNFEDSSLASYMTAAREMVEHESQRALCTQTWTLTLCEFPTDVIELRRAPVSSVSSIAYYDASNAIQTLSASYYVVDTSTEPARIVLAHGYNWPETYDRPNAVTITFVAGYGGAAAVPGMAKQAIRLLAGHWAINRESVGTVGDEIALSYGSLVDRLRWGGYR